MCGATPIVVEGKKKMFSKRCVVGGCRFLVSENIIHPLLLSSSHLPTGTGAGASFQFSILAWTGHVEDNLFECYVLLATDAANSRKSLLGSKLFVDM